MSQEIELGDRVKETITGLQGIAIGVTKWLNDCERWVIQPEGLHEGKPIDMQWFDVNQIVVLEKGVIKRREENLPRAIAEPVGGPMNDPKQAHFSP